MALPHRMGRAASMGLLLAVCVALLLACAAPSRVSASASASQAQARELQHAHAEWQAALAESHEITAEAEAEAEAEDDMRMEAHSEAHTEAHAQVYAGIRNGPITPARRVAEGAALQWKPNMPAKMKFARMLAEAEDKLQHPELHPEHEERHHSMMESHSRARHSMRSRARAASRSRSRARAHARVGGDAPDGGEGDWTTKPSWWNPPTDVESASPWREDAHAYLLRHRDPNTNMNPDPFPTLASRGAGNMANPIHAFALHRLAGTEVVAGTPMSVYAHQFPGAPPLPELDANMQPTNNFPNPPFYEHDYNKDYGQPSNTVF